ncbi:hypothetical protein [Kosakonia sp.]|uniref:hypothetical protein n=1 Tax=Kosakonia sp. TaxID=1916651 RepID=UPI0028A24977|nr:hypothetical protein [Kosakonia sp.]
MTTIVAILLFGGFFIYTVSLFYKDAKINRNGTVLNAKVENMRAISANESGSTNIVYTLSVEFSDGPRQVNGSGIIPTFYASQLEPGKEIRIKYLDDKNISFIFRE